MTRPAEEALEVFASGTLADELDALDDASSTRMAIAPAVFRVRHRKE